MGRYDKKNKEKAPLHAIKRGKGFGSRNTVWREAFAGTSEALNAFNNFSQTEWTVMVLVDC